MRRLSNWRKFLLGLGRAYAGEAAIADNASVVATNPALMSLFKTAQFSQVAFMLILELI